MAPAVAVALLAVLGCAALLLDRLWIASARGDLRAAADAGALAAARALADDDLLRNAIRSPNRLERAARQARDIVRMNRPAGGPVAPSVDVRFGTLAGEGDGRRFVEDADHPLAVLVTLSRTRSRSNPLALLLRGAGRASADVVVRSEASLDGRVVGVRPLPGTTAPVLPLAVLRTGTIGVRPGWDGWRLGSDAYRIEGSSESGQRRAGRRQPPGRVLAGPDGIPELILTSMPLPRGDAASAAAALRSNVRLLDFGSGLDPAELRRQILEGLRPEDLGATGGQLQFADGADVSAAGIIGHDIAAALSAAAGRCAAIPLYDELAPPLPNGMCRVRCAGIAAGRVMSAQTRDDGSCEIVLQPSAIATRSAVVSSGAAPNPHVFKLYLSH
ncbi:MAG: hypothetical protein KY476_09780 [Planctomycetes bacterium]|nr:hypothetical protein [Planctomycetota bacterium]